MLKYFKINCHWYIKKNMDFFLSMIDKIIFDKYKKTT